MGESAARWPRRMIWAHNVAHHTTRAVEHATVDPRPPYQSWQGRCAPTAQQQFMPLRQRRWPSAFSGTTCASMPDHIPGPPLSWQTAALHAPAAASMTFGVLGNHPRLLAGPPHPRPPSPILARSVRACAPTAQQQFMSLRQQQASAWGPGNHLRLEAAAHHVLPLSGDVTCSPGRGGTGGGVVSVVMDQNDCFTSEKLILTHSPRTPQPDVSRTGVCKVVVSQSALNHGA